MGKIILLNTPIGNLGDITQRVHEALKVGVYFAVEDTRSFKDLLSHLGISVQGKNIYSLHDQSETLQIEKLIEIAKREELYVASEAGSPIISDPGYPLIKRAYENGIKIESYSGVSSPIMALELSGLPPMPFHFHGFLAREESKKIKVFETLSYGTHIFFEAPTRIHQTMDILSKVAPKLDVALVRELSKKFEEVIRFKSLDWINFQKNLLAKGEFVLLIHQEETEQSLSKEVVELSETMLREGAGPKSVSKLLSLILDRPNKEIYNQLLQNKGK